MKLLIISYLFILSFGLFGDELPDLETFQRQLSGKLVKVTSIQSDFLVNREMPSLKLKFEFTGRLACDIEASRLLWRVVKPIPCAFRWQDGELSHWDGATGKILTISAGNLPWLKLLQEHLGQWLSGDLPALRKEAEIALVAANRVRLTPTGGLLATFAAAVEIEFSDDLTRIAQIRIDEKSGDSMTIFFRNTILNQPIPATAWELQ